LRSTPFKALNAAYMHDGFVLKVDDDVEVLQPVEILSTISAAQKNNRIYAHVILARQKQWPELLERHVGEGVYFSNGYTGIAQEPASRVKLYS